MKPVYQTKFGPHEGNCFAACVASMLEVAIEDVPNFCWEPEHEWLMRFIDWCHNRGHAPVMLIPESQPWIDRVLGNVLYIAGGPGVRGCPHAAIYKGRALVHDPLPTGTGLERIEDCTVFLAFAFDGGYGALTPITR